MNSYRLVYHHDVKTKDLQNISSEMRERIKKAIEFRLLIAPNSYGLPLRKTLKGYWKMRIGDYRVIYKVKDDLILIYCICHRKIVYHVAVGRS